MYGLILTCLKVFYSSLRSISGYTHQGQDFHQAGKVTVWCGEVASCVDLKNTQTLSSSCCSKIYIFETNTERGITRTLAKFVRILAIARLMQKVRSVGRYANYSQYFTLKFKFRAINTLKLWNAIRG